MKKRILAMLLAIVMLIGALPVNAFATEAADPATTPCETEGCEYASGHEGNCSNYAAPTEACTTEGCTYGANHEGDCSNYVAATECKTEGCTLGYGHEGNCGTSSNEEADAETADQAAAQAVIDLITAIGQVTPESEAAITAAESAYNTLTDAQKVLVTNYDALTAAKTAYEALQPAEISNTAPALKADVAAEAEAQIKLGQSYTLDLTTIFEDADSDELTYQVKIGEGEATAASTNYSYTPESVGSQTLVFTANDGAADSSAYTVTLTVSELSTDTTLNVLVHNSSSISETATPVKAVLGNDNILRAENWTGTRSYLWVSTAEGASVTAFEVLQGLTSTRKASYSKRSSNNEFEGVTYQGYYYNNYFAAPIVAKATVTAEDGVTTSSYYIIVSKEAASGQYVVSADGFSADNETCYKADAGISFTEADQKVTLTPVTSSIGTGEAQAVTWTWTTSDPTVALVDANGVVTSIGSGEATITATCQKISVSCKVTSTAPAHNIHSYENSACSVCGTREPTAQTAYFTLVGQNGKIQLYKASVTVNDVDMDGTLTLNDAFLAAHAAKSANGVSDFATQASDYGPFIVRLWGVETSNVGYYVNDAAANGLTDGLKRNAEITAYFYQDTSTYSDIYTYFAAASVSAVVGKAKTMTVKAVAGGTAAVPKGASVAVYDSNGAVLDALATTVGEDGTFSISFPDAGIYTVEVGGKASYQGSAWDSASGASADKEFTNAPVIPSRLTVNVYASVSKTVYVTLSLKTGEFAVGKNGDEIYRLPLTVTDDPENPDGQVTLVEVGAALHEQHHPDGVSAYKSSTTWVSKFWGNSSGSFGYYLNDTYMDGSGTNVGTNGRAFQDKLMATVVEDGDCFNFFLYQTSSWSDKYTYFNPVTETAAVGVAKSLKAYGFSHGKVSVPSGAAIKITDSNGVEQTDLATTVGADGTFSITFPDAGTYTVELRTNGSQYFVPSRCVVTVTHPGAAPADVTVTVSNKGVLALANGTVTVKDTNADGILTYHEALEAAHAAYCEGGYTATESEWGISVSEIWGVETCNSLFFRNGAALADHVGSTETSTVAEGDYLVVSVNKDDTYYSDRYSSFNVSSKNIVTGKNLTLTLKAELSTGSTAVPNATIGTWNNGVFTPLEGKITNDKGQVTLSFPETGTYIISASGTVSDTVQDRSNVGAEVTADCPLIAPVCVVTVVEAPRLADLRVSKVWADSGDYYKMTPAFDPYVTEYTVHVPDYTSSIFPYVTQAETNAGTRTAYYCCVRGFGMFGWTTSNNISLSSNTYFGAVIYGTSSTSMSDEDIRYTVSISKYATLKSLDVDGTAIIAFDRGTNDGAHYYVDSTAEGVKMTPTAHNGAYTVTINGTSVASGSEYTLPYAWDENGQMEVSITVSGTNVEENTYTLVLEKMPLNDAPFIMKEGTEADYTVIDDASAVEALFVTASANGELAYQWYYNTTESNENGILIEGATASTYTPPITEDVIGTRYYYCVVTNTGKNEGNTTASTATRITVDPDPTPVAVIVNPGSELTGRAWNTGYVYNVGDTAATLNVTASSAAEGGELSYQWASFSKAYNIDVATYLRSDDAYTASYTPSTELSTANTDGKYYGCRVTYKFKGKSYSTWAATGKTVTEGEGEDTKSYDVTGVYVFIKVNKAETPEITRQPVSATYLVGKSMKNLSVTASRADGGALTYQWYVNDTNSTEGGTAIEGATTTSCKLGTATESGTKYYYCVVTNTIQGYTSSAVSEVAEITVQAAQNVIGEKLSGSGTEEDPFLIADAQDYQDIYDFVAEGQNFEGLYLKQTGENITLPENWTPIGTSRTRFSGTLDGNGKTVTVPEGGLPLFGYVNGAAVRNLNIYGKKIAGYGLVNNLEGVGMSGEAVCIDNVTLKSGSSTLKSGLIGTYITSNMYAGCSATYYVTIKNCTIEEGVVIGYSKDQSMIGSFAGRVHGTIENCVSYAAVYGKDYVGGIVGTQDNALGGTVITDSQFHGKVEATGQHAGGIAGGGYSHSSGPNGNKININDCTVTGTVTGADKVGGIIGGDTYVAQLWGEHSLKNNSFTGTVKATSGTYVGGIIGFYDSLNKYDNISGNYYKAGCGAAKGIGFVQYVDTGSQTHETQSGAVYFNTGDGTEECPTVAGCGWKAGHNRTDDPLGADAAKLCYTDTDTDPIAVELKVSGTYKTEYTTGEKLDLTGIVLTVVYNDKSEKTINLSDATVTGYDSNKAGDQEITISYNGLTALITVKVENPKGEIKVTVAVYGDSRHGDNGTVHTLAGGGLTTWVSATTYTVDSNSTVWDVLRKAFADNGITCHAGSNNSQGTVYISALTRNGVTLAEFDNGANSGWMYTLNGYHSDNGVAQQYLKDGDKILFHYTDDYTKEQGSEGNDDKEKDAKAAEAAQKLIDAIGTVTLNSADEIEAAREAYDDLTYAQKQLVDNYAKLTAAETKYAQLKAADDEKKADAVEDLIDKISAGSTTFEDDVKAAQKAYNALTADQKELVDNYSKLTKALKDLADEEDKEAAEAVGKLIEDLGTITLDSEEDIKAARKAYNKLTDEQKALVENLADLDAAEEKLAQLKAEAVTEDIYRTTGDYIENLGTPVPGSIGGEWMVIGLIRSDREVPGADDYCASVVGYVQENIDENERLHRAKSSDNSRIILALTAMGKDVTNVDGHNLLNGLNDMAFIQKQGINGPIWALIAFDSGNYPTPEGDVTREALIQVILDAQLTDGGWALSGEVSDADMTGMAVQALAPYYESNADVKKALDEAIETLSRMQAADGSYGSIDGTSSESIAQVIVALAALGIDADKDERFVKNGISAVDALCAFYVEGGGFRHLMDGKLDGMATEQGYYALTAYFRMLDGKTSLYNMTDVMDMGGDAEAVKPTETLPAETEPAPTEPVQVEDEDKGSFPWWIIIVLLIAGAVVVMIVNRKKIFASVR